MKEIRVVLDLDDFKALVRGKIVVRKTPEGRVKIAVSDIGWVAMAEEVARAAHESAKR